MGNPTYDIGHNEKPDFRSHSLSSLRWSLIEQDHIEELNGQVLERPDVQALQAGLAEVKDTFTLGHSDRVAQIAGAVLLRMGFGSNVVIDGLVTGQVHDIGKDRYQHLIHLERQLWLPERKEVECHPVHGAYRAEKAHLPLRVVRGVGLHHGYKPSEPYGYDMAARYRREFIGPLSPEQAIGTAVAAADVFDASRSSRPERPEPRSATESLGMVLQLSIPEEVKAVFDELVIREVEPPTEPPAAA